MSSYRIPLAILAFVLVAAAAIIWWPSGGGEQAPARSGRDSIVVVRPVAAAIPDSILARVRALTGVLVPLPAAGAGDSLARFARVAFKDTTVLADAPPFVRAGALADSAVDVFFAPVPPPDSMPTATAPRTPPRPAVHYRLRSGVSLDSLLATGLGDSLGCVGAGPLPVVPETTVTAPVAPDTRAAKPATRAAARSATKPPAPAGAWTIALAAGRAVPAPLTQGGGAVEVVGIDTIARRLAREALGDTAQAGAAWTVDALLPFAGDGREFLALELSLTGSAGTTGAAGAQHLLLLVERALGERWRTVWASRAAGVADSGRVERPRLALLMGPTRRPALVVSATAPTMPARPARTSAGARPAAKPAAAPALPIGFLLVRAAGGTWREVAEWCEGAAPVPPTSRAP